MDDGKELYKDWKPEPTDEELDSKHKQWMEDNAEPETPPASVIPAEEVEPESGGDKMELYALLLAALHNIAQHVEMIPINYCFSEGARQNDKRPAYLQFYCPDKWVVNITKNEKLLDGFVAVRIPREFIQDYLSKRATGTPAT